MKMVKYCTVTPVYMKRGSLLLAQKKCSILIVRFFREAIILGGEQHENIYRDHWLLPFMEYCHVMDSNS